MALLGKVRWADVFPPDVFFLVHGEDGEVVKIAAHKLLLAGVSPVFAKKFFGPMKDTNSEVEVEVDTSPEAFGIMIDFIYSQETDSERIIKTITSPNTMFELYHLADYYDLEKLNLKTRIAKLHTTSPLRSFVTKENLTDCASVASGYKEIFPEFANKFQLLCLEVFFATFPRDIPEELLTELKDAGKSALQLPDWGDLAYFARDGDLCRQDRRLELVNRSNQTPISKISSPWKIFFVVDTSALLGHCSFTWVKMTAKDTSVLLKITQADFSAGALLKTEQDGSTTVDVTFPMKGTSRHKIKLIHQEEEVNLSLSVWVDNRKVGKTSCPSLLLSNLTDVTITWMETPGLSIRDFIVWNN